MVVPGWWSLAPSAGALQRCLAWAGSGTATANPLVVDFGGRESSDERFGLTGTLRRLERNGVIERSVASTRPVAVTYSITPLGKTLRRPVDELLKWAEDYLPEIDAAREAFDDAEAGADSWISLDFGK